MQSASADDLHPTRAALLPMCSLGRGEGTAEKLKREENGVQTFYNIGFLQNPEISHHRCCFFLSPLLPSVIFLSDICELLTAPPGLYSETSIRVYSILISSARRNNSA